MLTEKETLVTGATITIRFADVASERRFVESYLTEAWDRFRSSAYWEQGWYWRYGQVESYDIGVDGGLVDLVFDGDPEQLLAAEADRWEAFDGLTDWGTMRYDDEGVESLLAQRIAAKGDVGGDREYRYKPLTARLALAYHDEFDERLPPTAEPSDENPSGLGMFALVHALFVQCGYDWYEENDAYLRGLQNRVKSIAMYRGAAAAREEYERLRTEWEEYEAELEAWLEETATGTASV